MNYDIEVLSQVYDDILNRDLTGINWVLETQEINPNIILPCKGMNILHLAVGIDPIPFSEEVTRIILYNGGDPNSCTDEGLTPLHVAATWGRQSIVKMLLDHGADPYIRDEENKTSLDYAMDSHNIHVIDCLLEYFQKDKSNLSDSPQKYSFKLDKVIIDNGLLQGEYSLYESLEDCKSESDNSSIRKSDYVKDWCRNNSKSNYNFLNRSQELFRNKNGDIMFRKPLSCTNITNCDAKDVNTSNTSTVHESRTSSEYDTCVESLPNSSDANDTFTNENNTQDKNDSGQETVNEKSLSGFETLKFTRNEENDLYSVIKTNMYDNTKNYANFTKSRESNYIFPDSPVTLPHKNYSTKSSIRTPIKIPNDVFDIINETSRVEDLADDSQMTNNLIDIIDDVKIAENLCDDVKIDKNLISNLKNDKIMKFSISDINNISRDKRQFDSLSVSCRGSIQSKKFDETVASIVEEYKYEDKDAGVILIEKRIIAAPVPISGEGSNMSAVQSIISSVSSLPASVDYDVDGLRRELKLLGITPGPITPTTKRVYLKKLITLKKDPDVISTVQSSNVKKKCYTVELEKTLRDPDWNKDLSAYIGLEQKVFKQFDIPNPNIRWREGVIKSSFTYLLLDPRITDNLPGKVDTLSNAELWRLFLDSIFYIGKGKRSRPYSHLYQAVSLHKVGQYTSPDKKVQNILDIWKDDLGVVCLHIFQNVIPAEAYTREAAMIEVIGLKNLKNIKPGNYYGIAASWSLKEKKLLGVYLLYKAMHILLSEGERQLRPVDIR